MDARNFLGGKEIPKDISRIEVAPADWRWAEDALWDRVLPVRYYGLG